MLVHSDNTSLVSYLNHMGGLRSRPLCKLACQILLWSQGKLLSFRAAYIPGANNIGADILSRQRAEAWGMEALPQGGGADMEGVRPGTSGSVCISRDVSLSTLVLAHASSSSRTGRDGANVAKASSVCISTDRSRGVLERVRVLLLLIAPTVAGQSMDPSYNIPSQRASSGAPRQEGPSSQAGGSIFQHPTRTVETVGWD